MKRITLFALVLCLLAGPRLLAAESYLDALANEVVADLNDTFKNKIDVADDEQIAAAFYRFKDLTGKYTSDPGKLRQLLFGRLSLNKKYKLAGLDYTDGVYDSLYPYRALEELSQDQLKQLGKTANADYVFTGEFAIQDGVPVFQCYIYNVRKGVLLFTPVFPVKKPKAETPPKEKPADKPAEKEKTKTSGDNQDKPADKPEKKETSPFDNLKLEKIIYLTGAVPQTPIVDFEPMNIDNDPLPEIAFLTTDTMSIVKFKGAGVVDLWHKDYSKSFPRRGLAGTLFFRKSGQDLLLYVSLNAFTKTIVYLWDGKDLQKKQNLDQFVVDLMPANGARMVSSYGKGRISFSGGQTSLVTGADTSNKTAFVMADDYYAGCILEWAGGNPAQSTLAAVNENGIIKVFHGEGKPQGVSQDGYGGALDCWRSAKSGILYILTTTTSNTQDRLVLFKADKKEKSFILTKVWASQPLDGAITKIKFHDLNADSKPEIIGLLEKAGALTRLFSVAPVFAAEDNCDTP